MRILILNADYPAFLRALYNDTPGLGEAAYSRQMAVRNESLFGVADFYSRNLRAHGHLAEEIHVNNGWLQFAWAREHGLSDISPVQTIRPARSPWMSRAIDLARPVLRPFRRYLGGGGLTPFEQCVLAAQIEELRPDVVLNQDMAYVGNEFLSSIRSGHRLVVGQLAAPLPAKKDFRAYDLVISSLPNLVAWFRARGVKAELNRLAFDPHVLEELGPSPERDIDVSFVGSLSPEHRSRIAFLEYVACRLPLKAWGNGIERLPASSPLHACYQGEAWGRDMYNVLRRSRIALNWHIDMAEDWANNMRLYEATGMGAMLLTDRKKNLHEIFTPEVQVAVYGSPEESVAQIEHYLANEPARAAIAAAGQRQAIEVHNYYRRMGELLALIGTEPHRMGAGL